MALSPIISSHILPFALKLLYRSLRITVTLPTGGTKLPVKGAVITFWHGKMAAGWLFMQRLFPGQKLTAVVSLSEDGRILSDTLLRLGFLLIRGSSSKGASEVKEEMQKNLQGGGLVVLTPDGPRGPICQFKYGTLRLASSNHYPLVFAEITYAKAWKLKSWDQFEIPKPFSKATIKLEVINLPEFRSEEELHIFTKNLSDRFGHA